jgi:hypothetical protein
MANSTTLTNATFVPELWAAEIQKFAESNLVLASRVKRFDSLVKGKGDTIHIPKIAEITATAKSRNVDVVASAATEAEVQISINQHFYAAKKVEDILAKQSNYDLMEAYTRPLGYALSKKIDTSISTLQSGLSQSVGTGLVALTDATVVAGIVELDEADAPETDRHFAITPSSKGDILKLDKFVLFQNVNQERVNTGKLGEIYGVEVVTSTNLPTIDASPDYECNLMFHREAFALALQQAPRVQSQYKLESLADLLVVDAIWGVAEYRDNFAVVVKS